MLYRIDDGTQKVTETQTELVAQRRRNTELEKQVGKARVEHNLSGQSAVSNW